MSATILRTGKVTYQAGWRGPQGHGPLKDSPVYQTARVEEYTLDGSDRHYCYYPPGAATHTADGGVTLPADLLATVIWD